jgi:SsrA-binding protein
MRVRKLLMHKREINKLYVTLKQEGLSLIPLSLYFKDSRVKMQLGLCKGKKLYDKRADIAKRDANREIDRNLKSRNR